MGERLRRTLLAGVALAVLGAWAASRPLTSAPADTPSVPALGPALRAAQQRGVLRVAVRHYARPAPPGAPTLAEPDDYDLALASALAQRLGTRLEPLDLAAAGADLRLAGAASAVRYLAAPGRVVVMRRDGPASVAGLKGRVVCLPAGSPYAHRFGPDGRTYPSTVHAIAAFMAGECAALAEDEVVIQRLLAQPLWRFYTALPDRLAAAAPDARTAAEARDIAGVQALVAQWRLTGGEAAARRARVGQVSFEAASLEDGNICH